MAGTGPSAGFSVDEKRILLFNIQRLRTFSDECGAESVTVEPLDEVAVSRIGRMKDLEDPVRAVVAMRAADRHSETVGGSGGVVQSGCGSGGGG